MEKTRRQSIAAVITAMILLFAVAFGLTACTGTENVTKVPFEFEQAEDGGYTLTGIIDSSMAEIVVPERYKGEKVVGIAEGALANCTSATKIVIPNSVETIGKGALRGCRALSYLSIPFTGAKANAVAEKSVLGYIFGQSEYAGGAEVVQMFGTAVEDNETYYIPFSLKEVNFTGTKIPYGAFSNCNFISSFTVGPLVTSIEDNAFLNNQIAYVYVESNLVAGNLLGPASCGGLISNIPAVCVQKDVTRLSGYVESMDTKNDWTNADKEYVIYANRKLYRFEAEKALLSGGLSTGEEAVGANGVPTGGGYYVTGFYPNGGTGNCEMEFHITASKDTTATFIYCCGSRSTHWFKNCYRLTLNDTVIVPEKDVDLSLPAGVAFRWTQWTRYEIMQVNLKAGENVFNMHFTPDGKETAEAFSNDMYVDYIEFETDAILTWTN